MNDQPFNAAYVDLINRGPFPGRLDPWAEAAHYFHQIHSGMIGAILRQIKAPLLARGYLASKEASLLIADGRKSDISIQNPIIPQAERVSLNYAVAAEAVLAEPGLAVEFARPELQSIHIKKADENTLVTVVEIISPRNKSHPTDVIRYQEDRAKLFLERGVNVVEVDATRSVRRLVEHPLTRDNAYHTAVFIPDTAIHIIVAGFGEALKRCALPLRESVIAVDLQDAYDQAYQEAIIAPQIENDVQYGKESLPFPSLITSTQRQDALDDVQRWQDALKAALSSNN